jgi:hypothetical protein
VIAVQAYYDPQAVYASQAGAWRARLRDNHGIHDAGHTRAEAVARLVVTAATHGYSADPAAYQITD